MEATTPFPLAPNYRRDADAQIGARALAAAIRDGTKRSADVVEATLGRIGVANRELGAFVAIHARSARWQAERADRRRVKGGALPPFLGVPIAVKDHHAVAGTVTTFGTRGLPPLWMPWHDAFVRRLRRAGFVIVGKTAMSELGLLPIVETDLAPPARNPWDRRRSAGGSSGGAGAALAAGLLPVATGSDGAGSIRVPAALNGVTGHKASRGLVPDPSAKLDRLGLVSLGPMGRSIDDVAALLDVITRDGAGSFAAAAATPGPRLRIGIVREPPFGALDAAWAAPMDSVVQALVSLGHTVLERQPVRGDLETFLPIYQRFMARVPALWEGRLQPVTQWFREQGRATREADVVRRVSAYEGLAKELLTGADLVVTPAVGMAAPLVGAFSELPPRALFEAVAPLGVFTALANLAGTPATAIPWTLVGGMPWGLQVLGPANADATTLRLARELEGVRVPVGVSP